MKNLRILQRYSLFAYPRNDKIADGGENKFQHDDPDKVKEDVPNRAERVRIGQFVYRCHEISRTFYVRSY